MPDNAVTPRAKFQTLLRGLFQLESWKIVAIQPTSNTDSIRVAAFIFDQDTARDADVIDYLVMIDDVEERSGLEFLWELPPADQNRVESDKHATWAAENFG